MAEFRVLVFERAKRRAADDRDRVAGEFVRGQQLANFHLDEIQKLRIVDHVDLVHEHDDRRHADLTGEQDVLAGLRHRAVGRGHDQDRAVHLRGAGDHVLHIVGVARAVDMGVVAVLRLVFDVRRRDRDAARLLFRRLVDLVIGGERGAAGLGQHLRDRSRQRRLAMVDVTDRADVAMRLVPLKFGFTHGRVSVSDDLTLGVFRFDFIRDCLRNLLVVIELHAVLRATLGHRAQRVDVTEHVGERHHRGDDLRIAAAVRALHLAAPRIQIADDAAQEIVRRHHFDLHDRLEQLHGAPATRVRGKPRAPRCRR